MTRAKSRTIKSIVKEVFEEGQRYQQHVMQGENPKYIFTGAVQVKEIETLIKASKPEELKTKQEYYNNGYRNGIDYYEANLLRVLK